MKLWKVDLGGGFFVVAAETKRAARKLAQRAATPDLSRAPCTEVTSATSIVGAGWFIPAVAGWWWSTPARPQAGA